MNMTLPRKLIVLMFMLAMSFPLMGDSQLDIGVNVPTLVGVKVDGKNVTEDVPVRLPIPDLMYNYFFEAGPVKVGIGFRVWSIIVITAGYPIVSAEMEVGRLTFNAHIGGGIFPYSGVGGSDIATGKVFLPEISTTFKVAEWFYLGVGVLGIYLPEVTDSGIGYTVTVIGRFRVVGRDNQ